MDLDGLAHIGSVEVSGKDSKLGGAVKARMLMNMQEDGDSTKVDIVSEVDLMGRIGNVDLAVLEPIRRALCVDEILAEGLEPYLTPARTIMLAVRLARTFASQAARFWVLTVRIASNRASVSTNRSCANAGISAAIGVTGYCPLRKRSMSR